MTRILQFLVWITVMTATGRTQRGYSYSYIQNSRSISFPNTRTHDNYEYYEHPRHRQTEQYLQSEVQAPRKQRIQNKVTENRRLDNERVQISKRGGHRKHYLTKLFLELFAAIGAIEPEHISSTVVFPGPTSKSRFEPEISEECKKKGYCMRVPNYPKEYVKELIATLGEDVRQKFQMDELDTENVQIAQRFGSEGFTRGLCNSSEELIEPDSLPDKDGKWWPVLQDREKNLTQRFRTETCSPRDASCDPLVTFPPGYQNKCDQKFVFRSVLVLEASTPVAVKLLRLPSCCSCMITVPAGY